MPSAISCCRAARTVSIRSICSKSGCCQHVTPYSSSPGVDQHCIWHPKLHPGPGQAGFSVESASVFLLAVLCSIVVVYY